MGNKNRKKPKAHFYGAKKNQKRKTHNYFRQNHRQKTYCLDITLALKFIPAYSYCSQWTQNRCNDRRRNCNDKTVQKRMPERRRVKNQFLIPDKRKTCNFCVFRCIKRIKNNYQKRQKQEQKTQKKHHFWEAELRSAFFPATFCMAEVFALFYAVW